MQSILSKKEGWDWRSYFTAFVVTAIAAVLGAWKGWISPDVPGYGIAIFGIILAISYYFKSEFIIPSGKMGIAVDSDGDLVRPFQSNTGGRGKHFVPGGAMLRHQTFVCPNNWMFACLAHIKYVAHDGSNVTAAIKFSVRLNTGDGPAMAQCAKYLMNHADVKKGDNGKAAIVDAAWRKAAFELKRFIDGLDKKPTLDELQAMDDTLKAAVVSGCNTSDPDPGVVDGRDPLPKTCGFRVVAVQTEHKQTAKPRSTTPAHVGDMTPEKMADFKAFAEMMTDEKWADISLENRMKLMAAFRGKGGGSRKKKKRS